MDEILEVCNGDIRKVFLSMYKYDLDSRCNKNSKHIDKSDKAEHKLKLKN
jgi:hypothetical protein